MKSKLTYFVKTDIENGFSIEVQRDNKEPELCAYVPELNSAIGYAFRKAISSKNDYGNNNVKVVIEPAICSIDSPMVTI